MRAAVVGMMLVALLAFVSDRSHGQQQPERTRDNLIADPQEAAGPAQAFVPAAGQNRESKSDEAVKDAITLLKARRVRTEDKNSQDTIDEAIAALANLLNKHQLDTPVTAAESARTFAINTAALKKKLGGKAVFKADTGELTLAYDFKTKNQLKDFDVGKAKIFVNNNSGILINAADTIKHVVHFETLTLTAQVGVGNARGTVVKTSGGAGLSTSPFNGINVHLLSDENSVAEGLFANPFGGEKVGTDLLVPMELTVSKNRVGLRYGTLTLVKETKDMLAGQILFQGGAGGCQFQEITISGKVDKTWLEDSRSK